MLGQDYYEAGGGNSKKKKRKGKGQESPEAQMWKGLALTKKQTLNIKIRCELLSESHTAFSQKTRVNKN